MALDDQVDGAFDGRFDGRRSCRRNVLPGTGKVWRCCFSAKKWRVLKFKTGNISGLITYERDFSNQTTQSAAMATTTGPENHFGPGTEPAHQKSEAIQAAHRDAARPDARSGER